jgi:hypothetical protein
MLLYGVEGGGTGSSYILRAAQRNASLGGFPINQLFRGDLGGAQLCVSGHDA